MAKIGSKTPQNGVRNRPFWVAKQAVWLSKTGRFATQDGTRRIRRGKKRRQKWPLRGKNSAFEIYLPKPGSKTFLPKTRPAQQKKFGAREAQKPAAKFWD